MDAATRSAPRVDAAPSIPATMRALVREAGVLRLVEVETPRALADDEVLLRIELAGLCRTDCQVAEGRLGGGVTRRILGHEVAGVVVDRGPAAMGVEVGARVSVDPRIRCGACDACLLGQDCLAPRFLGVDVDGGFADYLRVPAASAVVAPLGLDLRAVAYIEPIAATLAILEAGIRRGERGAIFGRGRIAALAARILALHGFPAILLHDPRQDPPLAPGSLDFAVEAGIEEGTLAAMVRALRPRGRIVLKSRAIEALALEPMALIRRELRIAAAYYGSFAAAADLAGDPRLDLEPLWAEPRPLSAFAEVFAEAARGEGRKLFFSLVEADA
ncbi:MAG: alcohol dehydrogenase catalytic domain-containing protein [Myxococcales bacterium]|nr:alcohol dehydrogenase catalytic domain-containing protein [Myxococcales bacterium]